jgi:asparagine N-glycosylation enzyme membrane subunit Stt3
MKKNYFLYLNKTAFLLSFFTLSAFLLRLLTWKTSIAGFGKEFAFVQPDAFYHFRRAMIWAINFPKMPTLDYYMAYPYGAECPWPPLYDWFIALMANIITLGNPTQKVVGLIIALLPPVLAALCVFPTYKIVKLIFNNERIAIFSAFFAITMPGMLGYSHVASGDHHVAETFLCLWFFYYGVLSVKKSIEGLDNKKEALTAGLFLTLG